MSTDEYAALLQRLGKKCKEAPMRLADFAVNVQGIIRDETGEDESLESILKRPSAALKA